jgi:hypothetical protein
VRKNVGFGCRTLRVNKYCYHNINMAINFA